MESLLERILQELQGIRYTLNALANWAMSKPAPRQFSPDGEYELVSPPKEGE